MEMKLVMGDRLSLRAMSSARTLKATELSTTPTPVQSPSRTTPSPSILRRATCRTADGSSSYRNWQLLIWILPCRLWMLEINHIFVAVWQQINLFSLSFCKHVCSIFSRYFLRNLETSSRSNYFRAAITAHSSRKASPTRLFWITIDFFPKSFANITLSNSFDIFY